VVRRGSGETSTTTDSRQKQNYSAEGELMTTPPIPDTSPDYGRMMTMLTGAWVTQIVRAAAMFNLADHLRAGAETPDAIAAAEGTDVDATRRLLRTCAAIGLVISTDGMRFTGTALLSTLLKDNPHSLRSMILAQAAPGHWLAWGRFPDALRTGERQISAAHGDTDSIFEYFSTHLEEVGHFTDALANFGASAAIEIARVIDTRNVGYVLDVGGANGAVVRAMMRAHPCLRGGVLDLPHIVPDAAAAARNDGLHERFTAVSGDFFQSIPPADLYVLRYILHDWDDETCVQILTNCRIALREGGRVVVIDHVVKTPVRRNYQHSWI
jgi:O-methyltransferase domain/Dimerisation domain